MHISNAKPLGYPVARTSVKHDRQKIKSQLRYVKDLKFYKFNDLLSNLTANV